MRDKPCRGVPEAGHACTFEGMDGYYDDIPMPGDLVTVVTCTRQWLLLSIHRDEFGLRAICKLLDRETGLELPRVRTMPLEALRVSVKAR